ncbi:MAG: MobF family relaxase [Opitutaceae bacterium]
MLRPRPQLSLRNAREYFREHLCIGEYYAEGQKVVGEWLGQGAFDLGLFGPVGEKPFLALCEGRHPETGKWLTQRQNTVRRENGRTMPNRRIFHDFVISPPKSVSVVALYQDPRIVELHRRAVGIAMNELEKFAETRVRKKNQQDERVTGNIVAACFQHETSRELDPHLHTRCVVFNATIDPVEGRWKALQTAGMYRAQKFAENLYFHEVAKGLRSLGYEIENNARNFEIRGMSASINSRFSKRHEQIEAEARRQVAEGLKGDMGELRTRIAHERRRRKIKNSTADELWSHWENQLFPAERRALAALCGPAVVAEKADVRAMVAWADEHLFERRSVVNDYELMSAALARGRGQGFDLADLTRAIEERGYIRDEGSRKLTSRELYRCESEIVRIAQDRHNCFYDLVRDYMPSPDLSPEQARVAKRILSSRDLITILRGGAGTGKTHTLKEINRAIGTDGRRPVVVLTPQRQQVAGLQSDGLPAETLAHALAVKQLPVEAVVILDEAGQVGGRDLRELIRLVEDHGGRLILSGDTRQHGAVAAADALRAIEKRAYPHVATLRSIRRQNVALGRSDEERDFIRWYRIAVKEAADGDLAMSFRHLEKIGAIHELPGTERRSVLAREYLAAIDRGEDTLVVAQTWAEVHAVNDAIRSALREAGKLGTGTILTAFQPLDRSVAQRRDARFFEPGQAAFFLKGYGRFKKGERCEIAGATDRGLILVKNGRRSVVGYRHADRITVAKPTEIEIAPGDRLQLKANGHSVEGARLHNGELVTVARVEPEGAIVVADEHGETKTLPPTERLFVRGYSVTSYASQGKTADTVIVADAGNPAATNAQQWYVSISRGRKRIVIFTPDKEALRENIHRDGNWELAMDVAEERLVYGMRVPGPSRNIRRLIAQAINNESYEQQDLVEKRSVERHP